MNTMAHISEIFESMIYGPADENVKVAQAWIANKVFGPFIDGQIRYPPNSVPNASIVDPATGQRVATAILADEKDTEKAIASSKLAGEKWRKMSHMDRGDILIKISNGIDKHAALLCQIEALSHATLIGHPRELDVPGLVRWFKYYAGCVFMEEEKSDWEPYGVVASICANTSLITLGWMLAPALAAGNAVLAFVPREMILSVMLVAEICISVGLPSGLFNVLPGTNEAILHIIRGSDIGKISIFGPTDYGRDTTKSLSDFPLKKMSSIMSGKTPMIIFETADADSALRMAVKSAWINHGTPPWSVKMILVQESIYKNFVANLKSTVGGLRLGMPTDKLADVAPPGDKTVIKEIDIIVKIAQSSGVEVFQVDLTEDQDPGSYYPLTILFGAEPSIHSAIKNDFILPVLIVTPFRTSKEAVQLANNTRYGFAASVWSDNPAQTLEVVNKLEFGTVWINCHGVLDPAVPMEGWKESGSGSFGGRAGLLDSMHFKNLTTVAGYPPMDSTSKGPPLDHGNSRGREVVMIKPIYKLYFNGQYKSAEGNAVRNVFDVEKAVATVSNASKNDAVAAVDSSYPVQMAWTLMSPALRASTLFNMGSYMSNVVQNLISLVEGLIEPDDPETDPAAAVSQMIKNFKYWSGACDKGSLSNTQRQLRNMLVVGMREPLGVIGIGICEIDVHALKTLLWFIAGALACGNTIVLVVDCANPTIILDIFRSFINAAPPGIISILTGSSLRLMQAVASHPNVSAFCHLKIPLELASVVHMACSQNMKPVIPFELEKDQVFPCESLREFTELTVTRGKALWFNKGEIFAN